MMQVQSEPGVNFTENRKAGGKVFSEVEKLLQAALDFIQGLLMFVG